MKKIYLSWSEVDQMVSRLLSQIVSSGKKFDQVVGVANGGLYISNKIAQVLNIPHKIIKISYYDGMNHRLYPIIEKIDYPIRNSLIVDDLIDNGHTCQTIKDHYGLETNDIAVLFWNTKSGIQPTYFVAEKPDAWIVFAWE
jgi:hypoxanthine phosphoribosyltransferase